MRRERGGLDDVVQHLPPARDLAEGLCDDGIVVDGDGGEEGARGGEYEGDGDALFGGAVPVEREVLARDR